MGKVHVIKSKLRRNVSLSIVSSGKVSIFVFLSVFSSDRALDVHRVPVSGRIH